MATPIRILAVDDDPNMRRLYELYLNLKVFDITSVSSARLALQKLKTEQFDVLITDVQMPQMDGISLIKKIRKEKNKIPAIIISASDTNEIRTSARSSGANLILEKPFEQEALIQSIEKLFS